MVHGMRSPDALFPRDKLFITDDLEISPSKHTCSDGDVSNLPSNLPSNFPSNLPSNLLSILLSNLPSNLLSILLSNLSNLYLQYTQYLGQGRCGVVYRSQEYIDLVCWCIGEQLEVIGTVLVVGGDIECHQSMEELLTGSVVAEQCVSVHMVTGRGAKDHYRVGYTTVNYYVSVALCAL